MHSDVDEVDSDFDKPEEEDEPISDDENEEKRGRRKTKGYKVNSWLFPIWTFFLKLALLDDICIEAFLGTQTRISCWPTR